jgi:hypothetical protein
MLRQQEIEKLKKNIGALERTMRIIADIGLVPPATGLIDWRPPCRLLGSPTGKSRNESAD